MERYYKPVSVQTEGTEEFSGLPNDTEQLKECASLAEGILQERSSKE